MKKYRELTDQDTKNEELESMGFIAKRLESSEFKLKAIVILAAVLLVSAVVGMSATSANANSFSCELIVTNQQSVHPGTAVQAIVNGQVVATALDVEASANKVTKVLIKNVDGKPTFNIVKGNSGLSSLQNSEIVCEELPEITTTVPATVAPTTEQPSTTVAKVETTVAPTTTAVPESVETTVAAPKTSVTVDEKVEVMVEAPVITESETVEEKIVVVPEVVEEKPVYSAPRHVAPESVYPDKVLDNLPEAPVAEPIIAEPSYNG